MLKNKEKLLGVISTIGAIVITVCLVGILGFFMIRTIDDKQTEAYNAIPTYEEVVIDYMETNDLGRDCEINIRINRHYKANKTTLVYCGQNTIDFTNIINFNSIYQFEKKQIDAFTIYKWVYKGSFESVGDSDE